MQNPVTIKGSNKGKVMRGVLERKKQENLFDLFEVLDMFMIKFETGGAQAFTENHRE